MAQIKIYGERAHLNANRDRLTETIHDVLMAAIGLPADKRFHRFIPLAAEDFIHPRGRGYTIVEISMFEGRSDAAKRDLLEGLMTEIPARIGIPVEDLEITIFETPRANWGIRGQTADKLVLNYQVET